MMKQRMTHDWCQSFKVGRESVIPDPRLGRPSVTYNDVRLTRVHKIVVHFDGLKDR